MCIDSSNVSFNIAYMDILAQTLPDEVLGVVLGYSGKGFVCDEWELYLHHAFNFMTQYTKELCERHTSWLRFCDEVPFYLVQRVPSTWAEDLRWKYGWEVCPERRRELENLKKAMKFIMNANDNDPFIRFRVGKKVQRFCVEFKTPEDYEMGTGVYKLTSPFIETSESLRLAASTFYRHLESALSLQKRYDPHEHV